DWTDTGYPAVLEGAVRSGKQAAQVLMANFMSEP
ncbi:MAG: FAD-dependent oxidoreductase, partial [Alcaligenaceae bacterium]